MKIGAVIVTFNRLEKLKNTLKCYSDQSIVPTCIIVVDNCSTDGTVEYLNEWVKVKDKFEKKVIYLDKNTGGAGGFYTGMQAAMQEKIDWIWLSDDDAYPRKNALEELQKYFNSLSLETQQEISALCSAVYNDGKVHREHRNHIVVSKWKVTLEPSRLSEYEKEAFEVGTFSYVGALIKKETLEKIGLDEKDFFIYCDDLEHSIRVGRTGKIYCVPKSIIDHDTPPFKPTSVNWGRYYKKRNDLIMIKKNFPRRYFLLRFFRRYIADASIFSKNSNELKELMKEAYKDAWNNCLGVHEIYKPGWKPLEK